MNRFIAKRAVVSYKLLVVKHDLRLMPAFRKRRTPN